MRSKICEKVIFSFDKSFFVRVPTAGIFDKRLLLVDTCHAVGAVHWQHYRPLLCFPQAISQCDRTVRNLQGLLAGTSRLVVFPQLVYTWQSVDTASGQVRESWERDRMTRPKSGKWSRRRMFVRLTGCGNSATVMPFASCNRVVFFFSHLSSTQAVGTQFPVLKPSNWILIEHRLPPTGAAIQEVRVELFR